MFSTVAVLYIMLYIIIMQQRAHGQTKQEKVTVCVCIHPFIALLCSPHSADLNLIHQQVPTGF